MDEGGGTSGEVLRTYLAGRDVPCPVCRYNLRGCAGSECPECGARLDLRVGSVDLRLGPWLLGVLSLALPMGFSGICGVAALIGWRNAVVWRDRDWFVLIGLWVVTLAYAIVLFIASKRRARFLRRTRRAQWVRAGVMAVVSAAIQATSVMVLFGGR